MKDFSISPNDPKLAHAAAYGQIKQLRGDTKKLFDKIQALEGKTADRDGAKMLQAHFGKLIVTADVIRLKGSRPKAWWLVLDANVDGGSDMVAILVELDKHGWDVRDLRVRLTSHAVARVMQRTTKTSSLQRGGEVLRYHILAVLPAMQDLPEGHAVTTVSGSGALIWMPHDDGVRGATWLGIESIRDASLAKMCRDAGDSRMGVRLTKLNGEAWNKFAETVDGTSLPMALLSA